MDLKEALIRLHNLTLIEIHILQHAYYHVPSLNRELLNSKEESLNFSSPKAGAYHYHRFKNQEGGIVELEEAFHHYELNPHLERLNEIGEILGRFFYGLALFQKSKLYTQRAVDLVKNDASPGILNRLGLACLVLGDYQQGLPKLTQAFEKYQEIGDKSGMGSTLNNISQIYDARGDYDQALEFLEQSLAIQKEIGDKSGMGTTLNNISQIYDARGDYDQALEFLEQSLAIKKGNRG